MTARTEDRFPWTDERCDELRRLWAEGKSASWIADAFETTRNTIMGKVSRLKLPKRATDPAPRPKRRWIRLPKATEPRPAPLRPTEVPMAVKPSTPSHAPPRAAERPVPLDQRCTLLELRDHHCRWPYGDPRDPDFFFCGADVVDGLVYCAKHARMSYARFAPEAEHKGA